MTQRDAAFLWETEALRGGRHRGEIADPPEAAPASPAAWATLREAHYQTGIPIETLRKWARRGSVPSFLNESDIGVRRMVRMDAVRKRAGELDRPIGPVPRPTDSKPPGFVAAPPPETESPPVASPPADAVEPEVPSGAGRVTEETAGPDGIASPAAPEGTMIVPIAAWDKMLMQLGNLHEAGQQLAEARERAGKAETEASFLRERLGEMRRELRAGAAPTVGAPTQPETEPEPETGPAPEEASRRGPRTAPPQTEKLWRYVYRGWRQRRR